MIGGGGGRGGGEAFYRQRSFLIARFPVKKCTLEKLVTKFGELIFLIHTTHAIIILCYKNFNTFLEFITVSCYYSCV